MRLVGRLSAGCSSIVLGSHVGGIWLDPIKKNTVALVTATQMRIIAHLERMYINGTDIIIPGVPVAFSMHVTDAYFIYTAALI